MKSIAEQFEENGKAENATTSVNYEYECKLLVERCSALEQENDHLKEAIKHLMYAIH